MKILRVLNVGEKLQDGDFFFHPYRYEWVNTTDSLQVISKEEAFPYARPMYVPDKIVEAQESIPMSKKCKNLNTSREVWEHLPPRHEPKSGDRYWEWKHENGDLCGDWFRKITLPAPLTPIAFKQQEPQRGQMIFYWVREDKCWLGNRFEKTYFDYEKYTHWLPQDALPVPVVEKSLADRAKMMAANVETGFETDAHRIAGMLFDCARELRK